MATIVIIDDTPSILHLVSLYLHDAGHHVLTAADGAQGLRVAQANKTDLIITDVMMPEMDGYELTRRLRRDPATTHIPIITLTAHSELESKIKAFEAGADDFMPKPFDAGELVARVSVLLRRAAATAVLDERFVPADTETRYAYQIAVHSLRGGVGCSTLAVNTAVGLAGLWNVPVLLADFVTTTGQAALMLNMSLKRTWADLTDVPVQEMDLEMLEGVITPHASEMRVLMAPTDATQSSNLTSDRVAKMLELLSPRYGYIVSDLPHDFNDIALQVLDRADLIMLVLAPDLASIRAAAATLETYRQLTYAPEKIRVILNWTFGQGGFPRKEIEEALKLPIHFTMPHAPQAFVNAINRGAPPLFAKPEDPVSAYLEDLAFQVSRQADRESTPGNPTTGLKRVQKRMAAATRK